MTGPVLTIVVVLVIQRQSFHSDCLWISFFSSLQNPAPKLLAYYLSLSKITNYKIPSIFSLKPSWPPLRLLSSLSPTPKPPREPPVQAAVPSRFQRTTWPSAIITLRGSLLDPLRGPNNAVAKWRASSAKKRVVITDKARVGVQERRGGVIWEASRWWEQHHPHRPLRRLQVPHVLWQPNPRLLRRGLHGRQERSPLQRLPPLLHCRRQKGPRKCRPRPKQALQGLRSILSSHISFLFC